MAAPRHPWRWPARPPPYRPSAGPRRRRRCAAASHGPRGSEILWLSGWFNHGLHAGAQGIFSGLLLSLFANEQRRPRCYPGTTQRHFLCVPPTWWTPLDVRYAFSGISSAVLAACAHQNTLALFCRRSPTAAPPTHHKESPRAPAPPHRYPRWTSAGRADPPPMPDVPAGASPWAQIISIAKSDVRRCEAMNRRSPRTVQPPHNSASTAAVSPNPRSVGLHPPRAAPRAQRRLGRRRLCRRRDSCLEAAATVTPRFASASACDGETSSAASDSATAAGHPSASQSAAMLQRPRPYHHHLGPFLRRRITQSKQRCTTLARPPTRRRGPRATALTRATTASLGARAPAPAPRSGLRWWGQSRPCPRRPAEGAPRAPPTAQPGVDAPHKGRLGRPRRRLGPVGRRLGQAVALIGCVGGAAVELKW